MSKNKLQRLLAFMALISVSGVSLSAQQQTTPTMSEPTGPYVGQQPPGDTPELFAPGLISTSGYDMPPTFSPELDELFFTKRPTEGGSDNKIYYAKQIDGIWQEPVLASFSTGAMEFEAQLSCDGQTVFFGRGNQLCSSEKTETGWSEAQVLPEPVSEGMCVVVVQNGNIHITANRPEGYGIWRFISRDDSYQDPALVIAVAAHPFVAPDESYLLFDRYGQNRVSKLYVSFRNEDGTWSEPIEFGEEVNATGTELIAKVSPDGKYLLFQRKLADNTDVYWVDAGIIEDMRPEQID